MFTGQRQLSSLQVLGEQLGIDVYSDTENKDPVSISQAAIAHAKSTLVHNVIIIDTAGRLAVDEANDDRNFKYSKKLVSPHRRHYLLSTQ